MKTIILPLIISLSICSTSAFSQIVKTIDNSQPTSGDNFAAFSDAADYLQTMGNATETITFNVAADQEFIGDIFYLQEFNKGGGQQVIFQKDGTGNNPIIKNDLVPEAVIWLDTCYNITFDGINVADPSPTDGVNYTTAYYLNNSHNCEIVNSSISDFDQYGIYLRYGSSNILIDNNSVYYTADFYTSQSTIYGIYALSVTLSENVNVTNNRIFGMKNATSTLYGLRIGRSSGIIANNFISITNDNDKVYALRCDILDAEQISNVYHNTVYIGADLTDDAYGYFGTGAEGVVNLKNNIFINNTNYVGTGTDNSYAVYVPFAGPVYNIEDNIYFSNDPSGILNRWGTEDYYSLEDWQQAYGGDYGSAVTNVEFSDAASGDLHITGDLLGDFLMAATFIENAPLTDIDGETRDNEYPYKGADENIENPLNLHIDCDQYTLDFDDVYIGSPETLTFQIQNNGSENIIIDSLNVPLPFAAAYDDLDWANHMENITINAGTLKTIEVQCDLTVVESIDTLAHIYVPNGQIIDVQLSANALAPTIAVSTQELEFEAVVVAETSDTQTLTIENTGDEILSVSSIVAPDSFLIREAGDSDWQTQVTNIYIEAGNTQDIEIVFNPAEVANYNEIMTIESIVNIDITLKGRGKGIDFIHKPYSTGLWLGTNDIGDFNNDGYLDIITTGYGIEPFLGQIKLLQNNGDFTFTEVSTAIQGVGNGTVNFIDYNNDNNLDVFVAGQYDWGKGTPFVCSKLYQNIDGEFTEVFSDFAGVESPKSDWADIDLDGDLDLAFMGKDSTNGIDKAYLMIYENLGNNEFQETNIARSRWRY
jgi:parallel beta-helix repeat protein